MTFGGYHEIRHHMEDEVAKHHPFLPILKFAFFSIECFQIKISLIETIVIALPLLTDKRKTVVIALPKILTNLVSKYQIAIVSYSNCPLWQGFLFTDTSL